MNTTHSKPKLGKVARIVTSLIIGLTAAVFATPWAANQAFAEDYEYGGTTYQVIDEPTTWHEAVDYCVQRGGHLVTINSADEDAFVYSIAPISWLGASDEAQEGHWLWITGEPFDYTNWAPNEPTNWDPFDELTENVLAYWGDTYPGQWNDLPATLTQPFVCEDVSIAPQEPYSWSGFLQPINADGGSIFKLGRTVPVKFQLTGDDATVIDAVAKLYVTKLTDSVEGSVVEAISTSAADTGNTFRYSPTDQQYIFNFNTDGLTAGTYRLKVYVGGDSTTGALQGEVDISLR